MARSKVKSRSHYDAAHLQHLTNVPTTYQFLHLTVWEIQPLQDFIGQGHYSKVKSRSHNDVALLHPLTTVLQSINFLHFTASEIQPGQTISHRLPAEPTTHPDTMGEKKKNLNLRCHSSQYS